MLECLGPNEEKERWPEVIEYKNCQIPRERNRREKVTCCQDPLDSRLAEDLVVIGSPGAND